MSNIIFIPGIKGTELLLDTNKKWFPKNQDDLSDLHIKNDLVVGEPISSVTAFTKFTVNIYKGIYDSFSNEKGEISYFGYDWRQDIQTHVPALVQRIKELSNLGRVTIVAHSMGGMLAKLAILKMDELGLVDHIEKFITIGTPWGGSPDAFKALAYGEPGFYAELKPFFGLMYSYGDTRRLARQCPSVYQLLPSESYYKDEMGKFVKHREKKELQYMDIIQKVQTFFNEEYQENNPEYTRVPDVWFDYMKPVQDAMLKALPSSLKHHCIVGHKFPTLYKLPDGTSEKYNKFKFKSNFTNGDAVVPLLSGISQHATDLYYVKGEHSELCSNEVVIELLKGILNDQIDTLPQGVSQTCNMKLKWGLKTRFLCPIETTIMDSEGRYIAGAYDTDIVEESPILNQTEVKYVSVGDSQYIFFEEFNEDLKIQINSYETGVADISAEYMSEDNKLIELEFDPLPVDRGLTATVTIPVKEKLESANIERRGSIITKKRIRTTTRTELTGKDLPDRINLKVNIAAADGSKKAYRRDVFSGKVFLTIDSTNDELIDRIYYSINNETPQEYTDKTILDLPSGSFELQAFGKDTFDRPINTITSKFMIDNVKPVTQISIISTPDGMIIDFEPHTEGSRVKDTFYKIAVGNELLIEGTWEEQPINLPWGILTIDPLAKMNIQYNSVSEFDVVEDTKFLEITLGNIPQLMWDENTSYVTPEMILNNLIKHTSIDFNSFKIFANIKDSDNIKLNKNNEELTLNEGIKDNVKSVRFISNLVNLEVMFLEKYALYFVNPPTEKLKLGSTHSFSFQLLPDRGQGSIVNTQPQARIRSPKASKIPDKHIDLLLMDGTFYGSFYVDESFVQYKNKLIIVDNKNTQPPLVERTLITKED